MTSLAFTPGAADRVESLFEAWARQSIPVCVWKSADRWEEGVAGRTDFDLLIPPDYLPAAQAALLAQGWLPVRAESWRSFDGLSDHVAIGQEHNLHVHLHAQIVSGEKLIKSLRPPLTDLYMQQTGASYPPFISKELEFIVFVMRMVVKIDWIDRLGAVRRRSASAIYRNYQSEFDPLQESCDRQKLISLLNSAPLDQLPAEVILGAYEDLSGIGWQQRRKLRRALAPWRAQSGVQAWWSARARKHAQRKQGVGKTFAFQTPRVAICGPDGSGKTTLVDALALYLGRHLKVTRLYMGSNVSYADRSYRIWSGLCWGPYLVLRKFCKMFGLLKWQTSLETTYKQFIGKLLRRQKLKRLAQGQAASKAGQLVLYERFPLFQPHGDDGEPPIATAAQAPDLLVFLEVDEHTALSRRTEDREALIRSKVQAFELQRRSLDERFANTEVLVCAEDNSVEERVAAIVEVLDGMLLERARKSESARDH